MDTKEEGRPFYRQFLGVLAVSAVLALLLMLMMYGCAKKEQTGGLDAHPDAPRFQQLRMFEPLASRLRVG